MHVSSHAWTQIPNPLITLSSYSGGTCSVCKPEPALKYTPRSVRIVILSRWKRQPVSRVRRRCRRTLHSSIHYFNSSVGYDLRLASESLEETIRPEPEMVYPPFIATSQALAHLDELITFFEDLPASDLELTGWHSITVSSVARQLRIFRSRVN